MSWSYRATLKKPVFFASSIVIHIYLVFGGGSWTYLLNIFAIFNHWFGFTAVNFRKLHHPKLWSILYLIYHWVSIFSRQFRCFPLTFRQYFLSRKMMSTTEVCTIIHLLGVPAALLYRGCYTGYLGCLSVLFFSYFREEMSSLPVSPLM